MNNSLLWGAWLALWSLCCGPNWLEAQTPAAGLNRASQWTLRVKGERIPVVADEVTLGDLVDIQGPGAEREQLSGLNLGRLGGAQSVTYRREQLLYRLLLAGVEESQIRISGPETCQVIKADVAATQQRFFGELERQIRQQSGLTPEQITIEWPIPTLPRELTAPECWGDLEVQWPPQARLGNISLPVLVRSGASAKTLRIPVRLLAPVQVAVLTRPIARGQRVTADDLQTTVRQVDSPHIQLVSAEQVIGQVAARDLSPLTVLERSHLQAPAAVASRPATALVPRRSPVTVIYESQRLTIRSAGAHALEDGNRGDWIEVQMPQSEKRIRAQVVDAGLVKISSN